MNLKTIQESTDVSIYKKLITVLSEYSDMAPMTGISRLLNLALDNGKAILPKDSKALDIIKYALSKDNIAEAVQKLLNCKLSNLPADLKPRFKDDTNITIAFWNNGKTISDSIISLINFDKVGTAGYWCDLSGKKITLIN